MFNLLRALEGTTAVPGNTKLLQECAAQVNVAPTTLCEHVSDILSTISKDAAAGRPIKLLNVEQIAYFLAGIDAIASSLPRATDDHKIEVTKSVIIAAGVRADGHVTPTTGPVVEIGIRNVVLSNMYKHVVQEYADSVKRKQPEGMELAMYARKLQARIEALVPRLR